MEIFLPNKFLFSFLASRVLELRLVLTLASLWKVPKQIMRSHGPEKPSWRGKHKHLGSSFIELTNPGIVNDSIDADFMFRVGSHIVSVVIPTQHLKDTEPNVRQQTLQSYTRLALIQTWKWGSKGARRCQLRTGHPDIRRKDPSHDGHNQCNFRQESVWDLCFVVFGRVEDQQGEHISHQSHNTKRNAAESVDHLSQCESHVDVSGSHSLLPPPIWHGTELCLSSDLSLSLMKTDDAVTNLNIPKCPIVAKDWFF